MDSIGTPLLSWLKGMRSAEREEMISPTAPAHSKQHRLHTQAGQLAFGVGACLAPLLIGWSELAHGSTSRCILLEDTEAAGASDSAGGNGIMEAAAAVTTTATNSSVDRGWGWVYYTNSIFMVLCAIPLACIPPSNCCSRARPARTGKGRHVLHAHVLGQGVQARSVLC